VHHALVNPSKGTINMQQRSKYAMSIAGVVLAGTLAVGAVASASGNGDGDGLGARRHHRHLTLEQKCEHQDDIATKVATAQERIATRIATLQDKRATAETAGDTELVAKIDHRIERLNKLSERITTRYGTFQVWASEHCPAA
jgi:hypothetical protein